MRCTRLQCGAAQHRKLARAGMCYYTDKLAAGDADKQPGLIGTEHQDCIIAYLQGSSDQ